MRALPNQMSESGQSANGRWVRHTAASPLIAEGPVDERHRGFVPIADISRITLGSAYSSRPDQRRDDRGVGVAAITSQTHCSAS